MIFPALWDETIGIQCGYPMEKDIKIDEDLLAIGEWSGEGFRQIMEIEYFRVAVLRYFEGVSSKKISRIERHHETDEIFILTEGSAGMVLFHGNDLSGEPLVFQLKKNRAYNVKKAVWHQVFLSSDANIFIFERTDTNRENSEYHYPDDTLSKAILGSLHI